MFAFFERLIDPFPPTHPVVPPSGLMAFCWHYTKGVWPYVAGVAALSAVIGIGEAALFSFLGSLVDWLVGQDRASFLAENGTELLLMGLFILVVLPGSIFLQSLLVFQSLLGNYPMIIRWQGHRYLLGQSMAFFADEFAGRIATKLMQTSLAVRECVMKTFDVTVFIISYFIGMLWVVGAADWRLMVPLLIWMIVYIGILSHFIPMLSRLAELQADARSVMTGRIVDSYTNISIVKLFSHAHREEAFAQEGMEGFLQTVHRQMRLVTILHSGIYFTNSILLFAVAAVGISLWLDHAVTLGAITLAVGLVLRLMGFSYHVMWELSALFENIGTVADGMGMLTKEQSVIDHPGARDLKVSEGRISFDGIRFHYGKDGGVIDRLSLEIAPGEKVGLVGPSGAGKSTLMSLLLRLHDLEGGTILIDGQDVASVSQDSLRSQISMVTQDTALLHRSVRDNIAYGRPDATEAEIEAAARWAKAHEFIVELEDAKGRTGYDAHVGERGVKLSGGQRQRIAIARVFLKDAPILLLDEATSALDSDVEAAIQENLYRLMEGKTVIAIAHRLSTIAALDRLVVMDRGQIVEQGSHDQLLAHGGLYAGLWARQSGGFLSVGRSEKAAA